MRNGMSASVTNTRELSTLENNVAIVHRNCFNGTENAKSIRQGLNILQLSIVSLN